MRPHSLASRFSTTVCVAMPAWSSPGTQTTASPCIRRQRARTSWIATVSAWPMCSAPVTLGGGSTIANVRRSEAARAWTSAASGLNSPRSSHHSYHAASTSVGRYSVAIGSAKLRGSREADGGGGDAEAPCGAGVLHSDLQQQRRPRTESTVVADRM